MGSSVKQTSGISLQSNSAHFISLGNSRLSTEVTLFNLPIGNITIGSSQFCDIVLKGIQDVHCRCSRKVSEDDRDLGDVFLTPVGSAKVFVEGEEITDECMLQQGCMITLGDSIFLRFNFPAKAAILKNSAMESNRVFEKILNTNSVNFTENNSLDKSLNNNAKITEKMKNLKLKANDSYPKISNLQVYPASSKSIENCANLTNNNHNQTSIEEMEELEDVLKMFVEYNNSNGQCKENNNSSLNASNQSSKNNLQTSSDKINVVTSSSSSSSATTTTQNRIKTNGSLPKNFHTKEHGYNSFDFFDATQSTDDIENYKKPQSPRTRIKTFVSSPTSNSSKNSLSSPLSDNSIDKSHESGSVMAVVDKTKKNGVGESQYEKDYEKLIKSFEDKFRRDIFNIQCEENFLPTKNNHSDVRHTDNLYCGGDNSAMSVVPLSSRSNLSREKNEILAKIRELKILISESERQESETFLESDVEKNLVLAEMTDETSSLTLLNDKLKAIKTKMKQLEIERLKRQKQQEIQQIKLKNVIRDKEAEIKMIKEQKEITVESEYRLDELQKSLEMDRKTYEDLEFHYLEEETEWASLLEEYKENINTFTHQIAEKKNYIQQLEQTKHINETSTQSEQKSLETKLFNLKQKLENEREKLKNIDELLSDRQQKSEQQLSKSNAIQILNTASSNSNGLSVFDGGKISALSATKTTDIMSKSFNENMFFNRSKIEVSYFDFALTSSTDVTESLPRNSKIALLNRQSSHSETNASPLTIPKYHSLTSINHYSTDNLKATTSSSPSPPIESNGNGKIPSSQLQQQSQQQQQYQQNPGKVQYRQSTKQKRPLTRYLPNFSLDFNLRQHIETAGHQLQLCPHVIIDASSCRGYLNKVGSKPLFSNLRANTRWFVFDRQRQMFVYFNDKSEKKPRGGAYFNAITDVYFDHSTSKRTFIVKTKSRTFTLQAPSTQATSIWIDVIITGAQGKIFEYEK